MDLIELKWEQEQENQIWAWKHMGSKTHIKHRTESDTDHKQIILKLGCNDESLKLHGYSKLNNSLLNDNIFKDHIKQLFKYIFSGKSHNG